MRKEDLYLRKVLKGAAVYYSHAPKDQARIAKISLATWYRRLQHPETFTLAELRYLFHFYRICLQDILEVLGMKEGR